MFNSVLQNMEVYTSKKISNIAKKDPDTIGFSFGEPEFGPPEQALKGMLENELSIESFLDSVKRYEDPRGSILLRKEISKWYKRNYNIDVCPETEVMITHGGVEGIALSILATSEVGDEIMISDPSYMLYERTIKTLERNVKVLERKPEQHEYKSALELLTSAEENIKETKAFIINSPENPSGYVLSAEDWDSVTQFSIDNDMWIIHDEVYDTMSFTRRHIPARANKSIGPKTIMINSFSKKFGIPGLRIGWLVASKDFIDLAAKAHDYLYLGVNIQYEKIAAKLLREDYTEWLAENSKKIQRRVDEAVSSLTVENGFQWLRKPYGAMFLFPDVSELYKKIPEEYKNNTDSVSEAVANYLLYEKKVAVVPGYVYGKESDKNIRIVLCTKDEDFQEGLKRLKKC